MFNKEQIIQRAKFTASAIPADREDYDHEKNVEQYLRHIAQDRRLLCWAMGVDISEIAWRELVEHLEHREDIENGDVDLLEEYGTRDKEAVLDSLDQQIDYEATVLMDTAKEF